MEKHRGLIITRFNPITNQADAVLMNLLRNSEYEFDVYDGNLVALDIWSGGKDKYLGKNIQILSSETFMAPAPEWQASVVNFYQEHAEDYDFIVSWASEPEAYRAALQIKQQDPAVKWLAFLLSTEAPDFSGADVCRNAGLVEVRALASSLGYITKQDNPFVTQEYVKREGLGHGRSLRVTLSPMRIAKKFLWDKGYEISHAYQAQLNNLYHEVMANADQTFVLSNRIDDTVQNLVPCFDQTLFENERVAEEASDAPLKFVCSGAFNNQTKRLLSLIGALSELKKHDADLKDKIQLDLYGYIGDKDLAEIAHYDVADLMTVHSPETSYQDKLTAIEQADWAILVDENVSRKTDYNKDFPIEILDYLGAKKPILAISQYSGLTAEIVNETGCGLIVTHSASEIAMYLAKIIYQEYNPTDYHDEALKQYDATKVAAQLDKHIADLLS